MADENTPDPIAAMMSVDDEDLRGKPQVEAELNVEAPADKPKPEQGADGKFVAKETKDSKDSKDGKADEPKVEPTKEEPKRPETVPLATFLEKTNKLKADLEARDITLKEFQNKLAALEAKLPKEQPAPEPDFVEDPKGYVDHKLNETLGKIAEANKKAEATGNEAKETAAQAAQQVEYQRAMSVIQQTEQAFVAQNPDYYDALNHLRGVRAAQLREFTPDITPEQIQQVIVTEETNLAIQLMRQGRNPAATALNLAKTYGYQPKPAVKEEAKPEPKLPDVPNRRLSPDQTLGTGGAGDVEVYSKDEVDPFDVAIASLKRRSA
jgi:hypothetical protein